MRNEHGQSATVSHMYGGSNMLNRLIRRRKNQKGFTLIEILIVVVIVAILAAISVPIYL